MFVLKTGVDQDDGFKRKETQILRSMLKQISVFLLGAFIGTISNKSLISVFFQFHVGIELICIFISFLIFVLVWYTYEKNTYVEHNICFCFLMVGFFGILHLLFTHQNCLLSKIIYLHGIGCWAIFACSNFSFIYRRF